MKLNHLNLTVTDVRAAGEFLEKYFGLRKMGGKAGMAFLSDEDGFVLTLMKAGRATNVAYPKTFHIGFFRENEARAERRPTTVFLLTTMFLQPTNWTRAN